jgi:hypothetical protein
MAAITTFATISLHSFRALRYIASAHPTRGLAAFANSLIAKINTVITRWNLGTLDYLDVGSGTGTYYTSSDSWLEVDGTNPPTLSRFRIQELDDGHFRTVTCSSGVLVVGA